ncbi:cysteine desulfurase CsdA [Lujinxingia litoralis]|uniref:cysteine desulfurase n=1 Tax=Lujinxingia litoralis TaxID=2211119 RepID=A0A328CEC7_9DELT|nr:cysteine desulfurase [Lujinxingia litoralis]RAL25253.1 cysteine desulfurase CsdA [Lujinxingia litoralis]
MSAQTTPGRRTWEAIRGDFPVLAQSIHGHPLAYLDSAASSQMPQQVIDRLVWYHSTQHSNVHRGVHTLSQKATQAFEDVREKVRELINAPSLHECIFTSGTTESINLVAHSFGRAFLQEGDRVLLSALEHHANIVPWQRICQEVGAHIDVIPINDRGELLLETLDELLTERTKIVGVGHVSNALGTINPIAEIIERAHAREIPVLIDGAQAIAHLKVDVQALDADFYVFSGHKMCGPTGIGVLWGKERWLNQMEPYQSGGDMILSVSWEGTTYNGLPHKFEAGTPSIAAGVGLGAAINYLQGIGFERIAAREDELLQRASARLSEIPGVRLIGTAEHKASVLSFDIEGVHPHDIGSILDSEGVAVRAGHHCAQPVMTRLGIPATARASFAFYNDDEDIDRLVAAIYSVKEIFGV